MNEISNKDILSILINISKNNQIIPNILVDKLISIFNLSPHKEKLVEIFANIANNNQDLPKTFHSVLEFLLKIAQSRIKCFNFFYVRTKRRKFI